MTRHFLVATVASAALAASLGAASAQSRDIIQIAGSSTVLPFASIVAEEFGQAFPDFKTPVVGSGGTGGGLRQFCQGVGVNTIDIANSSRPIRPAEVESCQKAGVAKIIEVQFGASLGEEDTLRLEDRYGRISINRGSACFSCSAS